MHLTHLQVVVSAVVSGLVVVWAAVAVVLEPEMGGISCMHLCRRHLLDNSRYLTRYIARCAHHSRSGRLCVRE